MIKENISKNGNINLIYVGKKPIHFNYKMDDNDLI